MPSQFDQTTGRRSEAFMQHAMDAHGGAVYVVALSHTQSHADAQDVAQDVFLRLFTSAETFRSDDHLRAWLLRCAINRCHDLHRSAWTRRVDERDEMADIGSSASMDPANIVIAAIEASDVWKALAQLAPKLREVALLRYMEDLPSEEIARIVGASPAAVRMRLSRARNQMRKLLDSEEGDDRVAYAH